MKRFIVIVLLYLVSSLPVFSAHKIVYLISPPRSLSVGFLRMMEARRDFQIMHEPSQFIFDKEYEQEFTLSWFNELAPQTRQEVKERVLALAEKSNVFVKEMSFAVYDGLKNDKELIKNPNVYFIFLVRDPHSVVVSYCKKLEPYQIRLEEDLKGFTSFMVGYQPCYEIFEWVKAAGANPPLIIRSEDLAAYPEKVIQELCEHIDIPFKEESLSWPSLSEDFSGNDEWQEIKDKSIMHHWHCEAIKSTSFHLLIAYEVDANGNPTFSEIKLETNKVLCRKAYEENLLYYQKLMNEKEYIVECRGDE